MAKAKQTTEKATEQAEKASKGGFGLTREQQIEQLRAAVGDEGIAIAEQIVETYEHDVVRLAAKLLPPKGKSTKLGKHLHSLLDCVPAEQRDALRETLQQAKMTHATKRRRTKQPTAKRLSQKEARSNAGFLAAQLPYDAFTEVTHWQAAIGHPVGITLRREAGPPEQLGSDDLADHGGVRCRKFLGGLLRHYYRDAA